MEKTVSFQKANLVGVATLLLLVPFYVAYAYVWELPNIYDYLEHFKHYLYFFAAMVLLVFLHELIHAIFVIIFIVHPMVVVELFYIYFSVARQ